jgi:hypothetical protein
MFRLARLTASLSLSSALVLGAAQAAFAGAPIVDPGVLQPPPPPGAECQLDGPWTICHTVFSENFVNEPAFDLPCGTVYETRIDNRTGIRWYNADNKLVRRHVYQRAEGSWSLSSTGAAPIVEWFSNATSGEVYTVPGDLSSAVGHERGAQFVAKSPDGGIIVHISGRVSGPEGDEEFTGLFREASAEALCEALGS